MSKADVAKLSVNEAHDAKQSKPVKMTAYMDDIFLNTASLNREGIKILTPC